MKAMNELRFHNSLTNNAKFSSSEIDFSAATDERGEYLVSCNSLSNALSVFSDVVIIRNAYY